MSSRDAATSIESRDAVEVKSVRLLAEGAMGEGLEMPRNRFVLSRSGNVSSNVVSGESKGDET